MEFKGETLNFNWICVIIATKPMPRKNQVKKDQKFIVEEAEKWGISMGIKLLRTERKDKIFGGRLFYETGSKFFYCKTSVSHF